VPPWPPTDVPHRCGLLLHSSTLSGLSVYLFVCLSVCPSFAPPWPLIDVPLPTSATSTCIQDADARWRQQANTTDEQPLSSATSTDGRPTQRTSSTPLPQATGRFPVHFLPARRYMLARVLAMACVRVCPSQIGVLSKGTNGLI